MAEGPVRVYVGWDKRDALAFEVCRASLVARSRGPVEVVPLKDWELRARSLYWRSYWVSPRGQMTDDRDGYPFSTDFTYTRFLVPALENYSEQPVVFCDPDMLWRGDVYDLVDMLPREAAVAVVKHDYRPTDTVKITDNIQRHYRRKNWTSVMVLRPSECRMLTPYRVNQESRDWLHGMTWVQDRDIASLPEEWNWLEGWSPITVDPRVVHYTRGTPDIPHHDGSPYSDEWWAVARAFQVGPAPRAGVSGGEAPAGQGTNGG